MIVYGSAIENGVYDEVLQTLAKQHRLEQLLMSYYYLRNKKSWDYISEVEDLIVDSGAHSFQKGVHVEWEKYTYEYAKWIKEHDSSRIRGYFEMDVDNVLGYEKVLELRKILEENSGVPEKIIPVWHKNRGIADFKKMVEEHSIAAVTGFANEDIKDDQYLMFLKEAWKNNCWLHGLGMTRKKILDRVPFDSVDSASWKAPAMYGRFKGKKVKTGQGREYNSKLQLLIFEDLEKMQKEYTTKYHNLGVHNHPLFKVKK